MVLIRPIWLVVDLHLRKMMEFVSWDYYSQYMEKKKHVPNHQPAIRIVVQYISEKNKRMDSPSELVHESK